MSLFSSLCGCFSRPRPAPSHTHHTTNTTYHQTTNPFLPESTASTGSDQGYTSTPLPAYTARPTSVDEKTLEAHLRDPPISSASSPTASPYLNEKARNAYIPDDYYYYNHHHPSNQEDVTSDASSAISFPSSYGNTSTATRETPPPPYSPPAGSPCPSVRFHYQGQSRGSSRSMSVSSLTGAGQDLHATASPPQEPGSQPMVQITQPRPVFQRAGSLARSVVVEGARRSVDEARRGRERERRFSLESR